MKEKAIVIGDLHLNWQAAKVALDFAREQGINTAINLGDEAHLIYPVAAGDPEDYRKLFDELRAFVQEIPNRRLICVVGDKTAGVPDDMCHYYAGTKDGRIIGSIVFHEDNVIAAHNGQWILDEYSELIKEFNDSDKSLVIFHGHSHSMGVLPEYKWLNDNEFVIHVPEGEEEHKLEPGKAYWVNPGGNFVYNNEGQPVANLAVYDPSQKTILLKTIPFRREEVKPSK